ncbi:hypothetical protein Purlil1_13573 [Purpureocillium lilacinum]|uniref:Uncharacterized protein n=1 Tax=Purpureocillium lilacinum TaxID=33203 RepID=A0ABR0BDV8_PURLI|nr:hypothetical protein Purlil1_13573 [Purpureocillium lilacinum]
MGQLVRPSDQSKLSDVGVGPGQFLREHEIAGNVSVFTTTGYDTTITMTWKRSLHLLIHISRSISRDEAVSEVGEKYVI